MKRETQMALRQTDRKCEKCGNIIRASEIYFANRDGGDLHVDCYKSDQSRMMLRRGMIVDPMKTPREITPPWSHVASL